MIDVKVTGSAVTLEVNQDGLNIHPLLRSMAMEAMEQEFYNKYMGSSTGSINSAAMTSTFISIAHEHQWLKIEHLHRVMDDLLRKLNVLE